MTFFKKVIRIFLFLIYYSKSLFIANLRIAWEVLRPGLHIKPGIVAIEIKAKSDFEIMIFTNLLMMTPGTMALNISKDRQRMYVHVMYLNDIESSRNELEKDLQDRVLGVLRILR